MQRGRAGVLRRSRAAAVGAGLDRRPPERGFLLRLEGAIAGLSVGRR